LAIGVVRDDDEVPEVYIFYWDDVATKIKGRRIYEVKTLLHLFICYTFFLPLISVFLCYLGNGSLLSVFEPFIMES
jgi:hypothetical protein